MSERHQKAIMHNVVFQRLALSLETPEHRAPDIHSYFSLK